MSVNGRTTPNASSGMNDADGTAISREGLVRSFFSGTGRSYDKVAKLFTLGLDNYWKAEIVKLVPDSERVLDLGCGTGILTEYLAMRNPCSEIVGVDITSDYLAEYGERLRRQPWIRAHPVLGNAETVTLEGEFDAVASSYLAKYVDPDLLVSNVTPHLRKGGAFIAHDFIMPTNPVYLASWLAYTWALHRVGPFLLPEWHTAFKDGFGLVRGTRWMDAFMETLREHGYRGIHRRRLSFGTAGLVWATRT
jgi:ubiquinone/menaquinone biosynthesis C-methylase UbiE